MNDEDTRIGFIAEDTPEELSSWTKDQMRIGPSVAVVMKAIQELDERANIVQNKKDNALL